MRASPAASKSAQGAVEVQAAEAVGVVALAAAVGAGGVGERGVDQGVGRRAGAGGVGEGPGDVAGRGRGVVTRWPAAASAGDDEAADGAGGAGERGRASAGRAAAARSAASSWKARQRAISGARRSALGLAGSQGFSYWKCRTRIEPPVPELGQVEPDVLQQVVVDRQALPVGEEGFEEGLVGALPERAGRVEAGEHRGEGRGGRAGRRRRRS